MRRLHQLLDLMEVLVVVVVVMGSSETGNSAPPPEVLERFLWAGVGSVHFTMSGRRRSRRRLRLPEAVAAGLQKLLMTALKCEEVGLDAAGDLRGDG